jgi:streptogramin lyase
MDDKPRGLRDNKPRGIQVNSEGISFYVKFGTNNVASIDPATTRIREYPLPDPSARPRRLAITQD